MLQSQEIQIAGAALYALFKPDNNTKMSVFQHNANGLFINNTFDNSEDISDPCNDSIFSKIMSHLHFIKWTEMAKCFVKAKGAESERMNRSM